ncbi:MAG: GNAT family N-acetyltransferase [Actinobacteria bacterium]|nr:GNAT family N-acetyltransferase [Actinomycetota bacterium]
MPDFSAKPTLRGERVTLRPVTGADAATLQHLMTDPEVGRLTGSVHSSSADAGDDYPLDQLTAIYAEWARVSDRIVWVIIENATGEVVGESVLNDLDEANLSCGFRIWIAGATGRGLGTEAVRLSVGHAFATGLHRVELEVYDFNPRARHVYERVGFGLEGTRRQALRFDDGWVDCHVMGLLASDWRGGEA